MMKINKMTVNQIRAALKQAARNGDEKSKYVEMLHRRLEVLKNKGWAK